MRLGLRRGNHHHRLHGNPAHSHRYHDNHVLPGFPRFITRCTLPCLRQPRYEDSDLGLGSHDQQRGSLLAEEGQNGALWEEDVFDEDDLDARLSMFSNTQGQEPEDTDASGTASEQNNESPAAMPRDTSCHTVNGDHRDIFASTEHAQEHAPSGMSQSEADHVTGGHLEVVETERQRDVDNNWNSLRDFFPEAPMANYRRLWHRPDLYTRYTQHEEVNTGRNEDIEASIAHTRETDNAQARSPLFGFLKNGMPLVGHRSLFDPSLWEPLLGTADPSPDPVTCDLVLQGDGDGASDLDVRLLGEATGGATSSDNDTANFITNGDHSNNNSVLDITGATDQESSDDVSQISYLQACSSNSSSNLDLNVLLQNSDSPRSAQHLNPPALTVNQDNNRSPNTSQSQSRSGSSQSGSLNRQLRREWYFYDPRLVPGDRADRITMETQFLGIHNQMSLPGIIGPPAYEDIIGNEVTGLETVAMVTEPNNWMFGSPPAPEVLCIPEEPPPPYAELPPSYEQTMGEAGPPDFCNTTCGPLFHGDSNTIAVCNANSVINFNHFRLSHLQSSPVMNHLATINDNINLRAEEDNLDLDIDLDLMEVQGQPYNDLEDSDDLLEDSDSDDDDDDSEDDDLPDVGIDGLFRLFDLENDLEDDGEVNQRSLRRYPIGFCLGQRPAVRWSRSMGLDRWASSQNWALHGAQDMN